MTGYAVRELRDEVAKLTNEMQLFTATRQARDEMSNASVMSWAGNSFQSGGNGSGYHPSSYHVPVHHHHLPPPPPPPQVSVVHHHVPTPMAIPLPAQQPQQPYTEVHTGYYPDTTVLDSRSAIEHHPRPSSQRSPVALPPPPPTQFSTTIPKYHVQGQPLTVIGPDGNTFNVTPPALPPGSQFLVQPPMSSVVESTSSSSHQQLYSAGPVYRDQDVNHLHNQQTPVLLSTATTNSGGGRYSIPEKNEKAYFSIQTVHQDPIVVQIYDDEKMKVLLSHIGDTTGVLCDEHSQVMDLEMTPKELGHPRGRLIELRYIGGSMSKRAPAAIGSPKSAPRPQVIRTKGPVVAPPRSTGRPVTRGGVKSRSRSRSRSSSVGARKRRGTSPKSRAPPPPRGKPKSVSFR